MSTVIKANQTGRLLRRLSGVDLADHLAEAQSVIDRAKREAAAMIEEARRTAAKLHADAKRAGHTAGYGEGEAAGRRAGYDEAHRTTTERLTNECEHVVTAMKRAISEFEGIKAEVRIAAERDVLVFAMSLASRMTFAIGRKYSESVRENLRRALGIVAAPTDLTIRVNPDDREIMETFAPTVLATAAEAHAVTIAVDDAISRGGCTVTSGGTDVDATLDTQIDELVSLVLGEERGGD